LLPYVYNEEDKTIVVANTYTFQLSENGTSISGNIGGKDYTVMLTDKVYEPKEYVEFGVYEGIYYSSHNKKIIKLDNSTGPEDSVISIGIWIEETDEKYTTNNLSNYVTVIDSKHIERNGITYELLEAGEFK